MSRVADALVRAGRAEAVDDHAAWERDKRAGQDLLENGPASRRPTIPQPSPFEQPRVPLGSVQTSGERDSIPFELAALVRSVFLTPGPSQVRSVLFSSVAGESTGDVAWDAAELLALQSGRRVGFVEDGSRKGHRSTLAGAGRVTRVGWFPPEPDLSPTTRASQSTAAKKSAVSDVLGERVNDLFRAFDFVVVHATALRAEDLVPLAQEVEGVVLLISEGLTRRKAAETLAHTLRASNVRLLGAVLRNRTYPIPTAIYRRL